MKTKQRPKKYHKWTMSEYKDIAEMYTDGEEIYTIAYYKDTTEDNIRAIVRKLKAYGMIKNDRRKAYKPEEVARMIEARANGFTFREIADQLKRPYISVYQKYQYEINRQQEG